MHLFAVTTDTLRARASAVPDPVTGAAGGRLTLPKRRCTVSHDRPVLRLARSAGGTRVAAPRHGCRRCVMLSAGRSGRYDAVATASADDDGTLTAALLTVAGW